MTGRVLLNDRSKGQPGPADDLLSILEGDQYEIDRAASHIAEAEPRHLIRGTEQADVPMHRGEDALGAVSIIIIKNNGEQEYRPPPRRCMALRSPAWPRPRLKQMIDAGMGPEMFDWRSTSSSAPQTHPRDANSMLAIDQLLNAVHLVAYRDDLDPDDQGELISHLRACDAGLGMIREQER